MTDLDTHTNMLVYQNLTLCIMFVFENLLYQESVEVMSKQESTISFTWTPYESGSIQITSEVEEYDETISKYAYVEEPEEENINPVAAISATILSSAIRFVSDKYLTFDIAFAKNHVAHESL